jgi:hypothetical protein
MFFLLLSLVARRFRPVETQRANWSKKDPGRERQEKKYEATQNIMRISKNQKPKFYF